MNWVDADGDFVSDENPYTIVIKEDTYLKAIFETVQYDVVADAEPVSLEIRRFFYLEHALSQLAQLIHFITLGYSTTGSLR